MIGRKHSELGRVAANCSSCGVNVPVNLHGVPRELEFGSVRVKGDVDEALLASDGSPTGCIVRLPQSTSCRLSADLVSSDYITSPLPLHRQPDSDTFSSV